MGTCLLASATAGPTEATEAGISFAWSLDERAAPTTVESIDGRAFILTKRAGPDLTVFDIVDRSRAGGQLSLEVDGRLWGLAIDRSSSLDPVTSLPIVREQVFLAGSANDAEILVVDAPPGGPLAITSTFDLPGRSDARAVALKEDLVIVARARSAEPEILVLDRQGTVLGELHLPARVDSLEVDGDTVFAADRRRRFEIDLSTPSTPVLVAVLPRPAAEPAPVEVRRMTDFVEVGPKAYLTVRDRGAELQEVPLGTPLGFADHDSDGLLTLGCAGNSNTQPHPGITKWCELLEQLVDDPVFRVVNVAEDGATAIPSSKSAYDQVPLLLDPAAGVDAVVLSFGTNDTNLTNFDPDPTQFDSQLDDILAHLEVHASTIASTGRRVYVATVPPRRRMLFDPDGFNERIIALNERIRASFPAEDIVEHYEFFYSDTTEVIDGVHLNQLGQHKRAWRALLALTR